MGERFFSRVIENVDQFLKTFKYIDENPVVAKIVAKAEEWEYGGLHHHLQGRLDVVDTPRGVILELFWGYSSA